MGLSQSVFMGRIGLAIGGYRGYQLDMLSYLISHAEPASVNPAAFAGASAHDGNAALQVLAWSVPDVCDFRIMNEQSTTRSA